LLLPRGDTGEIKTHSATSKPADISRCVINSAARTLAWLPISSGRKEDDLPTNILHYVQKEKC